MQKCHNSRHPSSTQSHSRLESITLTKLRSSHDSRKDFDFVSTSAGFALPRIFTTCNCLFLVTSCSHKKRTSRCLTLPAPCLEVTAFAAELSILSWKPTFHPRSLANERSPMSSVCRTFNGSVVPCLAARKCHGALSIAPRLQGATVKYDDSTAHASPRRTASRPVGVRVPLHHRRLFDRRSRVLELHGRVFFSKYRATRFNTTILWTLGRDIARPRTLAANCTSGLSIDK